MDDYENGLTKPLSYGERRALEELRKIDRETPVVPAKVKTAVEHLFDDPKSDLAAAAAHAGLSTYRLRNELKKPHVRTWIWHERRLLLDALCAQNPAALKAIRDTSENSMAQVSAVKTIEAMHQMAVEETRGGPHTQTAPGLVVIIEHRDGTTQTIAPMPAPMIEVTPLPERELGPPGRSVSP
jgi:hypothetical protein